MPQVTKLSPFAANSIPTPYGDCAYDLVVNEAFIDLTAAQLALNNIFDVAILPAGHKVVDMVLIPDDLDTNGTPTIALDVGILTGTQGDDVSNTRVCGSEYFAADVSARTGTPSRMSARSAFLVQPVEFDRSIGVKIQAAPATAAAGRIRLQIHSVPADHRLVF